jgi:hypothetical protein
MEVFDMICETICEGEGQTMDQLKSETREQEIVFARQLIMFFAKKMKVGSLSYIGRKFDKDHATVIHSIKTINNYLDTDKYKRSLIISYAEKIGPTKEIFDKKIQMQIMLKPLQEDVSELEQRLINVQLSIKNIMDSIDSIYKYNQK